MQPLRVVVIIPAVAILMGFILQIKKKDQHSWWPFSAFWDVIDLTAALAPAPSCLLLLFSLQFVGDGVHLRQAARIDGEACSKAAHLAPSETLTPTTWHLDNWKKWCNSQTPKLTLFILLKSSWGASANVIDYPQKHAPSHLIFRMDCATKLRETRWNLSDVLRKSTERCHLLGALGRSASGDMSST